MERVGKAIARGVVMLAVVAALGACATAPSKPHPGLSFAQASCGGCHAVEPYGVSPNPASPSFAAIVNQSNLSDESLATWLRDAHNYPEEMDFHLEGPEVDALVAYMLTLRDPNYRPEI